MSNRLTKIYTRQGDDGNTCLANGERVSKDSPLIHAQGDIDELNSNIACIRAHNKDETINALLIALQHHLFNIGAELTAPQCSILKSEEIDWLERWIDYFNHDLPALKEFILPGGSTAIAHCHVTRTVCRRTERSLINVSQQQTIRPEIIRYINRLSDLLFVLSRVLESNQNSKVAYWDKHLTLPEPNDH